MRPLVKVGLVVAGYVVAFVVAFAVVAIHVQAYLPYGQEGVLVQAIKVEEATGLLATRYAPERYQELRLE